MAKKNKVYKIANPYTGEAERIEFEASTYAPKYGGGLAIEMWCDDGPYATLTVNLYPTKCKKGCAFIDVNDLGYGILAWLEENGIAHPTNRTQASGFVTYPEVEFEPSFLEMLE